jgi:radical SAM protein with 4Fe4S-binding SPASM domain
MNALDKIRYEVYRFKYNYGKRLDLKSPVDVSIEMAAACDMACTYCYWSDPKNIPFTSGIMNVDLALKIVNQSADLGVHSLKFNYRGEGTLNHNYTRVTKFAKHLAKGSTFIDRLANSNFKFHPKRRDDIFEGLSNLTKVKVSYDSFIPEVFDAQRAGGNHKLTTENITMFYNHPLRRKSETEMVIQAVRTKLNKDEDIESEVKKRWPEASVSIRDMVGGRVEKDLSSFEGRRRDEKSRQSCNQAHVRLMIHWDGRVGACCPAIKNDLIIGDINKQSVYEIFNSYEAKRLRTELLSGKAFEREPCKSCSSFESYKGFKSVWTS